MAGPLPLQGGAVRQESFSLGGQQFVFGKGNMLDLQIGVSKSTTQQMRLMLFAFRELEGQLKTMKYHRQLWSAIRDKVLRPSIAKNFQLGGRYDYSRQAGLGRHSVVGSHWWTPERPSVARSGWWDQRIKSYEATDPLKEEHGGSGRTFVMHKGPGNWPPISPYTMLYSRKVRTRPSQSWPPLTDTGRLRKKAVEKGRWSFRGRGARDGDSEMVYGNWPSDMHYAVQHDLGSMTNFIPPRPFAVVQNPHDTNQIERIARLWLDERIHNALRGYGRSARTGFATEQLSEWSSNLLGINQDDPWAWGLGTSSRGVSAMSASEYAAF